MNVAVGTMVVCLSCRKVVWADDSDYGDVRGFANHVKLACPKCGDRGNFDGWRLWPEDIEQLGAYDGWSAMRKVAELNGFTWEADGESRW